MQTNGKSMPHKYSDQTKREAIGIRQIHNDISFTRYTTAVRERALHRWREQLRKKQNSSYVRKNFSVGHKTDTKSASRSKQRRNLPTRRLPNGQGVPPPRVYILYLYTMPKHGYFMGILWACHGHLLGHSLRDRRSVSTRPTRPSVVKKFEAIALRERQASVDNLRQIR